MVPIVIRLLRMVFLFGFNRLAIIDPHERSMQPLVYKNIMMVNGELYNYRQLRNDLSLRGYTFKMMVMRKYFYTIYMNME